MSTDNQKTETAQYYIYQLSRPQDLQLETFRRRQLKCAQAQSRGFLFDLSENDSEIAYYINFVAEYHTMNDAILLPWSIYKKMPSATKIISENKNLSVFFVLTQENELIEIQPELKDANRNAVLQIKSRKELLSTFNRFAQLTENMRSKITFLPRRFNSAAGQMVSAVDYLDLLKMNQLKSLPRNQLIPFWNDGIDGTFELEPLVEPSWATSGNQRRTDLITISVIIPTYNNARFLVNVLAHLAEQSAMSETYEVIVVDDGSDDDTSEIVRKFVQSHNLDINLLYLYWSKKDFHRGPQNFFRPGQARNLAAKFAIGEYLMFLDSDMLVPPTFIKECQQALKQYDLIQFQRYHISQKLSQMNPRWENITLNKDCYIEEKHYWSKLFESDDWNMLPQKWKYVCTYALGIRRQDFFHLGRIRRHFISYGFEDTDLGFRMYLLGKKFKLVKTPLLHLTNYSQMQYQNSSFKRHELLSETAKLLFLDHLDFEVGTTLRTFLGGEKSLVDRFKDRFLNN